MWVDPWKSLWGWRRVSVAVGLVVLCLAGPTVAAAGETQAQAAARAALLTPRDFGAGWTSTAAAHKPAPMTCSAFHPALGSAQPAAAAVSRTFAGAQPGPYVSQTAYAFTSSARARTYWQRVVRRALLACVAQSLSGKVSGATFVPTSKQVLGLPKIGDRSAGYRVAGTETASGQTADVYLDMFVVGRGREISAISIASFQQPADRALELRLARRVAARERS